MKIFDMNHDEYEIPDDFFDEVEEFNEKVEKKFEPLEETNGVDEDFNTFEPNNEPDNNIENYNNGINVSEVKTRQKLYKDGKKKECGRCHNLKPLNQFGLRKDSRSGTKYLRSNCISCLNDLGQIRNIINKYHLVMNIYNGSLEGKCQKCETGPEMLPALEFHHLLPKLKSRNLKMRDK